MKVLEEIIAFADYAVVREIWVFMSVYPARQRVTVIRPL